MGLTTMIEPIGPLDLLPPISLADLQAEAAFLTRRDRKYLVPVDAVGTILEGLDPASRVLEIDGRRGFGYLTPYFDDGAYSAYLRAARRRPDRFKVRTRLYIDSGLCRLEVKVRDARGRTVKHRTEHDAASLEHLADGERAWLSAFPQVAPYADRLRHCLTTRYQRTTLVLPDGTGRVTIDRDLVFALPSGESYALPRHLVVETKGTGRPTAVDRLLWRHGFRPVAMSKFACGMSLLVAGLPANRWHRLRTRLTAAPTQTPHQATVSPAPHRTASIRHGGAVGHPTLTPGWAEPAPG